MALGLTELVVTAASQMLTLQRAEPQSFSPHPASTAQHGASDAGERLAQPCAVSVRLQGAAALFCANREEGMWSFGGVPYHTAAWHDRAVASRRVLPGTAAAKALRDRAALGAAVRRRLRPEAEPMIVDEFDCETEWQLPALFAAAQSSLPTGQSGHHAGLVAWQRCIAQPTTSLRRPVHLQPLRHAWLLPSKEQSQQPRAKQRPKIPPQAKETSPSASSHS